MAEIRFEFESVGGDAVAESLEDIQVKERLVSEEAKRLSAELREIRASGQVSAQGIEVLTRELVRAEREAAQFSSRARQVERATNQMTRGARRFHGGGAEMVNMLTEMSLGLGGISPQMREFTVGLASAGNNVSQLARVLPGPVGIIVGLGSTLLPLLITKIVEWSGVTNDAAQANDDLASSARRASEETRSLVQAMRERVAAEAGFREEQRLLTVGQEGNRATSEEIGLVIDDTRAQMAEWQRRIAEEQRRVTEAQDAVEAAYGASSGRQLAAASEELIRRRESLQSARAAVEDLRREEQRLLGVQARVVTGELAMGVRADADAQDAQALEGDSNGAGRRAERGRVDVARDLAEAYRRVDEAIESGMRRQAEAHAAEKRMLEEKARLREEDAEREKDALHGRQLSTDEQLAQHDRLAAKQRESAEELLRKQIEAVEAQKEAAREAFQNTKDEAESVLGPAIQGISGAISEVIAGSRSADEAFQGLLAGFLEMLAQKAALEAASEFASAIASFASQDYSGGALHLAAGVAWTAVAVASGAASIAVAPPAAATPAEPQRDDRPQNNAGSQVVVNLNGAVVTAGTRAELGRELGQMIAVGDRRFGAAA